ncbi:MAG: haloacid dehalogenase type II [Candidatus Latescibacterota bacterium]|nr:MAG: haloacid dehalogenase type II [Candidatus Latescibacterota bacterium]
MLDFDRFELLTFDCYGTLIDWEAGILSALRPLLQAHAVDISENAILELYARFESAAEMGEYRSYRKVLRQVVDDFGRESGFTPTAAERLCLVESLAAWPPFEDTVVSLRKLHSRYQLGIFSNIDADLFESTATQLGVDFDHVVTASRLRTYKPASEFFQRALAEVGVATNRILHVAQSLHHDIAPARELGLCTVWVDRRRDREGFGATPPAQAAPDLIVPDLGALVNVMGL